MIPKGRLGRQQIRHLKVYRGPDHPHEAQVNAGTGKKSRGGS
jgi:ribosomal protein L13